MNRKECERVIFNKMLEIVEVLKKYDPTAERLSLTYIDEHESTRLNEMVPEYISFNTKVGLDSKIDCIDCTAFKNAPWENSKGWALREM